mgnify:CR=1 FL=1
MWRILADVARRRWWLLGIGFVLPIAMGIKGVDAGAIGLAVVAGYGVLAISIFEGAHSRAFEIYETLPISRKTLGRAYWTACIGLFPGVALTAYAVMALMHAVIPAFAIMKPGVVLACGLVVLSGLGGFSFAQTLLSRPGCGQVEQSIRVLMQQVILVFFLAFTLFFTIRIANPASMHPPGTTMLVHSIFIALSQWMGPDDSVLGTANIAAMAMSAIMLMASWWLSPRLLEIVLGMTRTPRRAVTAGSKSTTAIIFGSRLRGLLSPWLMEMGQIWTGLGTITATFGCVVAVIMVFCLTPGWTLQKDLESPEVLSVFFWPYVWMAIGLAGFFLAGIQWLQNVRAWRALPIARGKLAGMLMAFPLLAFVVGAGVLVGVMALTGLGYISGVMVGLAYALTATFAASAFYLRTGLLPTFVFVLLMLAVLAMLELSLPAGSLVREPIAAAAFVVLTMVGAFVVAKRALLTRCYR